MVECGYYRAEDSVRKRRKRDDKKGGQSQEKHEKKPMYGKLRHDKRKRNAGQKVCARKTTGQGVK